MGSLNICTSETWGTCTSAHLKHNKFLQSSQTHICLSRPFLHLLNFFYGLRDYKYSKHSAFAKAKRLKPQDHNKG